MAERKQIDWEGVERDYSAGLLTLREIGDKYGVSHTAIRKKSNNENWARDLSAKIEKEANLKVSKLQVSKEVSKQKAITEKDIVQANAQVIVDIKLSHRKDIARGRVLVAKLFDELESCTDNKELFDEVGELLRSEDKNGQDKLNDLYHKIISMPQRIDGVKKLSESLRILIDKERQAFDIQDKTSPVDNALSDLVKNVQKNSLFVVKNNQVEDLDDD
jgi:hypothetical protein